MDTILDLLHLDQTSTAGIWVSFIISLTLMIMLGKVLHRILIQQMHRMAARTAATWDDLLIAKISKPTYMMLMTVLVYFSAQMSHLPFKTHPLLQAGLRAAFIVFLFWTLERILTVLISSNTLLSSLAESSRILVTTILRAGLLLIGLLMVLDTAGISITPLLASLGVGSVAVALALQDTLSNLFSGLYILADKPFQIGDFIEVEGGIQGNVTRVGWRSSHVRTTANNIVVIPNSKMASSIMTNFDLDDGESALLVPVGVAYNSDLDKVESVAVQTASEVLQRIQPNIRSFKPFVRYKEFADSSINLTIYLRALRYDDNAILRHEFIKALHKAFAANKIEIPFPTRVIELKGDMNV